MPGQSQDQGGAQGAQSRQSEQPAYQAPPPQPQGDSERLIAPRIEQRSNPSAEMLAGKQSAFQMEAAVSVKGRAGERNINIEWVDVPIGYSVSCRFNIRTAPGNTLEANIEQGAYNKTYTGSGMMGTQAVPVAPTGTQGKLTVRDTTTGETLEQPWTWHPIGGEELLGLWEKIKKLFWKSES